MDPDTKKLYTERLHTIISYLPDDSNKDKIKSIISDYGVDRIIESPFGHKKNKYVGVYPGGWVDFLSNFIVNSVTYKKQLEETGFNVDFSDDSLVSLCFLSLLYKLGYPDGDPLFLPQTSSWRREKLDEHYSYNQDYSGVEASEINVRILLDYGIQLSRDQYQVLYNFKYISSFDTLKLIDGTFSSKTSFVLLVSYVKTILELQS